MVGGTSGTLRSLPYPGHLRHAVLLAAMLLAIAVLATMLGAQCGAARAATASPAPAPSGLHAAVAPAPSAELPSVRVGPPSSENGAAAPNCKDTSGDDPAWPDTTRGAAHWEAASDPLCLGYESIPGVGTRVLLPSVAVHVGGPSPEDLGISRT